MGQVGQAFSYGVGIHPERISELFSASFAQLFEFGKNLEALAGGKFLGAPRRLVAGAGIGRARMRGLLQRVE